MTTSTTPEVRPQRADARRNRERLLAAAREAFEELGVEVHVDEVAKRAEVGVGTLYRHFPTKEALMGELVAEKFRLFRDHAREALETVEDPWEALAGTLRRNAEAMSHDTAVQQVMTRTEFPLSPSDPAREELVAITAELIERARLAGAVRDDLSVDDIPMLMCGLCATMAHTPFDGRFDWRRHLELILAAMRP